MLDEALKALIGYGAPGIVAAIAIFAVVRIYADAKAERDRNREFERALTDRTIAKYETMTLKAWESNAALRMLVEQQEERIEREKMERERAERLLAAHNKG